MAFDSGSFLSLDTSPDVLGGEDTIGELPYPQEYDYFGTDERNALDLHVGEENGIWNPKFWLQGASDRQGVAGYSPLVIGLLSGFLYTVFMLVGYWVNPGVRSLNETPRLENDEKCGITTGGQVRYLHRSQLIHFESFRRNAGGTVRSYQTHWWQAKLLLTLLVLRIVLLPQLPQLTTVLKT